MLTIGNRQKVRLYADVVERKRAWRARQRRARRGALLAGVVLLLSLGVVVYFALQLWRRP